MWHQVVSFFFDTVKMRISFIDTFCETDPPVVVMSKLSDMTLKRKTIFLFKKNIYFFCVWCFRKVGVPFVKLFFFTKAPMIQSNVRQTVIKIETCSLHCIVYFSNHSAWVYALIEIDFLEMAILSNQMQHGFVLHLNHWTVAQIFRIRENTMLQSLDTGRVVHT